MPFYVYKTTNLLNGKYYVGVHNKNDDYYLGSGILLNKAIKKYGRISFSKEILKEFKTSKAAYNYEKVIVTDDLVLDKNCYNLALGGKGGNIHSSKTIEKIRKAVLNTPKESILRRNLLLKGRKKSKETIEKIRKSLIGRKMPESVRKKISKAMKGKPGRIPSQETRDKISRTLRQKRK